MSTASYNYPEDFGAVGNGTTDDTAAIQQALNAMATTRELHFKAKRYRVNGTLTVSHPGKITGEGRNATYILAGSASANVFNFAQGFLEMEEFKIEAAPGVTRTGGSYINCPVSSNITLRNFEMDGAHTGISSNATVMTIAGAQIRNTRPGGISIAINDGFDVSIRDVIMDAPGNQQPFAGIAVFKTGDCTIEDCNIIHQGQDLYISPRAGQGVFALYAVNTFFDTANAGVVIAPQNGGVVGRCMFNGCWMASHSTDGIRIDSDDPSWVDGVQFNNCHVFQNANNGLTIPGGPAPSARIRNIDIRNSIFAENAGSGIWVNNSMNGLRVVDNVLMAWGGFNQNGNPMWFAAGGGGANRCLITDNHSTSGLLIGALGAQSRNADNVS